MRASLILAAILLLVAVPAVDAQPTPQCAQLEVRQEGAVGYSIRPEVETYRARVTYRNQGCGIGPIGSPACGAGQEVVFTLEKHRELRGNLSAPRVVFQNGEAATGLQVVANLTKSGDLLSSRIHAVCSGSRVTRELPFRSRDLFRVHARVVDSSVRGDAAVWRIHIENTGNTRTTVEFEPAPAANETNRLSWEKRDVLDLRSAFDASSNMPQATEVEVRVTGPNLTQPFLLTLRPNRDGDPSTYQEPVVLSLTLIELRGETPQPSALAALLVLSAVVVARRR